MADESENSGKAGLFKSYPKDPDEKSGLQFKPDLFSAEKQSIPSKRLGESGYEKGEVATGDFSYKSSTGPLYKGPEDSGAIYTTKKNAEDKSFISFGHYEYGVKALEASADWKEKKGELSVVKAEGKISIVHAEIDFIDSFKKLIGLTPKGNKVVPPVTVSIGGPFAARVGDPTIHGTPLGPGTGSTNVIIGGMPAWRSIVDFHACSIVKGVVPDVGGVVALGVPTVLVNGFPMTRAGNMVVEIPGGPNAIINGCATVLVGSGGAAGTISVVSGETDNNKKEEDKPAVDGELTANGDLLTAQGELDVGANIDLGKGKIPSGDIHAKIGGSAAVAKGEIEGAFKLRIPWTDHYVVLGGKGYGSALSIGAEAGGRVSVNKVNPETGKKQLFHVEGGAKAELGLGLGLNFSLSIE